MSARKAQSDFFLMVIAFYKIIQALLFFAAGIGVLHLLNKDVGHMLLRVLNDSHVDPENHFAKRCLKEASKLTNFKIESISAICFFYGLLFGTEGLGLYFKKVWAEYLVVIITGSLLPLEAYELWLSVTPLKVTFIVVNLAIVGYLIYLILRNRKSRGKG